MMAGLVVERVFPGSIADELGLAAGDRLIAVNGHPVRDIIDYNFYASDEELTLEVEKGNGELWEVELERDEGEPLGLLFPPPRPRQCGNNCLFCFVHQLPAGLRSPLYVKDEDYRLSFLYGNYVTLTNVTRRDIGRIKEQRLSPLYVSVHATEPDLRERLLGRRGIPPVLDTMRELAAAGITMHAQVVLCPGVNDGLHLEKTVADLAALYPRVASLAIVPVGMTGHRRGLPSLAPVTDDYAAAFVPAWGKRARDFEKSLGGPFLFLADEFYIKGGLPFPPLAEYDDLPQVENGVGMVPLFMAEAEEVVAEAVPLPPRRVTVVTGESPVRAVADFLRRLSGQTGADLRPAVIRNLLFGESVTVTGLLSGGDIIAGLRGRAPGDLVLIPDVMLKEGERVFLDGLSPADLERELHTPVRVVESSPRGIYSAIMEKTELRAEPPVLKKDTQKLE